MARADDPRKADRDLLDELIAKVRAIPEVSTIAPDWTSALAARDMVQDFVYAEEERINELLLELLDPYDCGEYEHLPTKLGTWRPFNVETWPERSARRHNRCRAWVLERLEWVRERLVPDRPEGPSPGPAGPQDARLYMEDGTFREPVRKILNVLSDESGSVHFHKWSAIAEAAGLGDGTVRNLSKPMQQAGLIEKDSKAGWRCRSPSDPRR